MFNSGTLNAIVDLYGAALPATILMAITFSFFGVFVVLKRIVFIGITLSEVAAFGVAISLIYGIQPFIGAAVSCLAVVGILAYPYESSRVPRDTVLGTIFIFASGMSILLVSRSGFGLEKVKALLYGNLLFASNYDLLTISLVMLPAIIGLTVLYRPLLYSFLDREVALTLGINVWRFEMIFFISLGLIVASSSKIAGVMLVFCYLVVPPATALVFSRKMKVVIPLACSISVVCTLLGIVTSYNADLPPNQLVAAISCCFFLIAVVFNQIRHKFNVKVAYVLTIVSFCFLLLFLNSLKISSSVELVSGIVTDKEVGEKLVKKTEFASTSKKSLDWVEEIEKMKTKLNKNNEDGKKYGKLLLSYEPPEFFKQEIIDSLANFQKSVK